MEAPARHPDQGAKLTRRAAALLAAAVLGSLAVLAAPFQTFLPVEISWLEAAGFVAYAWSVWLLARNLPLGWWVALVGVAIYAVVFYRVRLFAEVGIQVFYFVTSAQAIWVWVRGGKRGTGRPVGMLTNRQRLILLPVAGVAVWGLHELLVVLRGAAPFWDSLSTVISLVAHLLLMGRFVDSWVLWVAVDVIYVPLYASRGLYLTSVLYAALLVMSIRGLQNFLRLYRERTERRAAS